MKSEPSLFWRRKGARPSARQCHSEGLESRIALTASAVAPSATDDLAQPLAADMSQDGVAITATEIRTAMDIIPRFAANPTITAIRSGNWNDPSMWSAGRLPGAGDRISIGVGRTVFYAAQSDTKLDSLEISGSLIFSTTTNTRMVIANITVMPGGLLQIGSDLSPVSAGVTAELVIADKPIDLANDPRQFGTGLIGLGRVSIQGAALSETWQQLAAEPLAGSKLLLLSDASSDWKPGDTLVLPDSRQVPASQADSFANGPLPGQWEEVVIDRIVGNVVLLKDPLKYDHLGARDMTGQLQLMPYVALLNRNVIVRSENPNGTRGHTLFTARADVNLEYARFLDLGRTDAFQPLDNTTFDANGNVTHYGTNQIARYAVHFHHLMGPVNATNTGYQFQLVGNTIENSRKWAVDVHGTSFGLVEGNVVYGAQGAGYVTEAGSEIGNIFRDNIAIRVLGTRQDGKSGTDVGDYGRGGSGFWFRRGGNTIVGNVAVDTSYAGFVFDGYNLDAPNLPLFRGANVRDPAQSIAGDLVPSTLFLNNTTYGWTNYGLWAAYTSGDDLLANQPITLVYNFRAWNVMTGVWAYHTSKLTFDHVLILGDLKARDRNDTGAVGMDFEPYENYDVVIRNSRIEGMYYGIIAPTDDATQAGVERPTKISTSTLKNYINIVVQPGHDTMPSYGNVLEVRNVKFQLVTQLPDGPYPASAIYPPANIWMRVHGENLDYTHTSIVRVYDYNQVAGDNFQVFYREQNAGYVLPQTDMTLLGSRTWGDVGSPAAGLTNAQNWAKYGIALAGTVAPAGAKASRPEINGLVAPIQPSPAVPRVVLVTPWNNAVVTTSYLRVRYNVVGALAANEHVYVQLDGGEPITNYIDGGFFDLSPGNHTVLAYIGDASGKRLPNTSVADSGFRVSY